MKTCTKCGTEKPLTDFALVAGSSRRQSWRKVCRAASKTPKEKVAPPPQFVSSIELNEIVAAWGKMAELYHACC